MRKFHFISYAVLILFLTAGYCISDITGLPGSKLEGPENFDEFIIRFKTDRDFRHERIIYPLEGYNSDDDDLFSEADDTNIYFWNLEKFDRYIEYDYSGDEFIHTKIRTDTLVIDKTYIDSSGFQVHGKYILKNNKWYLKYYDYSCL